MDKRRPRPPPRRTEAELERKKHILQDRVHKKAANKKEEHKSIEAGVQHVREVLRQVSELKNLFSLASVPQKSESDQSSLEMSAIEFPADRHSSLRRISSVGGSCDEAENQYERVKNRCEK